MTFQPPPENQPSVPPGPAAAPPGYQQPGFPPQPRHGAQPVPPTRGGFDPKTVNPLDWTLLGIGFVLFVFSFFSYYTWSYAGVRVLGHTVGGGSVSYGAWHTAGGTFLAWFAMAIGVLAAVPVALTLFAPQVRLPLASRALSLILFAASFALYVIAIFAHDDFGPGGGHGFSFWLSLILAGAATVIALMRAQATHTALPGPLAKLPTIGGSQGRR